MRHVPVGVWIRWKAWFKLQGPPGALGDDIRAASTALAAAKPYIAENDQRLARFLPAGRVPADYAGWLDFGEDAEPDQVQVYIE